MRFSLALLLLAAATLRAEPPKPPIVNDPALKIELLATGPEVEACTTVCGAPDGAFYVGCDLRDGRLSTDKPECFIVKFSGMGADRKHTIFADKIFSPAGSAWHDGWLYVTHDPFLSRFKDTDGDGIADVREDLISNLGVMPYEGLNDHCVSGFTLGMDGFFYISVGDRGIYQAKSARDGSRITMQGGGIIRCRTDGTQMEIFSTGTRNHLQVNLDAEDNAFTRDNTDDGNGWWTRLTHHIEGGYYGYPYDYRKAPNYGVVQPSQQTLDAVKQFGVQVEGRMSRAEGQSSATPPSAASGHPEPSALDARPSTFLPAMADFGGGSPTGGLCYLSDGLPEKYRGKHFFSEWGKGGVFVTEVARDGATFKLLSDTKLIEPVKGADFRPMQLSVAADGSLLIADWGYGGWKSPRVAGGIWRLSWPESKITPRLKDESKATVEELIAALGHPDRDQRLRAEWALMGKVVVEFDELAKAKQDVFNPGPLEGKLLDFVGNERGTTEQNMHALWTLQGSFEAKARAIIADQSLFPSMVSASCIGSELTDGSPPLRVQAARAMGFHYYPLKLARTPWLSNSNAQVELAMHGLDDQDPAVRLRTVQSLARMGIDARCSARVLAATASDHPWIQSAGVRALQNFKEWGLVATALHSESPAMREMAWAALAGSYDEQAASHLRKAALDAGADTRARAVAALGRIAYVPAPYDGKWWGTQPVKNPPPPHTVAWAGTAQALGALTTALSEPDAGVRLAAAKAFTGFILDDAGKDAGAALRGRLTAESDAAVRRQIIESLGVQKDPEAMEVFREIALGDPDMEFRETAIAAVVNIGGEGAKRTIALLAELKLSPAATRKIIVAAGELKVLEAAPALIAHLKDDNTGHREAAAKALGAVAAGLPVAGIADPVRTPPGSPIPATAGSAIPPTASRAEAIAALIATLEDKDAKVAAAAAEALGNLRDRAALPALIALAEKKKFLKETIGALANMPDESAIPVLVETLRDKNTGFRRGAIKALKSLRGKAHPAVEALLASGRVPEELVPEIRQAFEGGAIAKWKMVGPFENVWEAVHPPETDALAIGTMEPKREWVSEVFPWNTTKKAVQPQAANPEPVRVAVRRKVGTELLSKKYVNAEGKEVGWMDVAADAEGRVDLEKVFKSNAMVCAYALAEIESAGPATAKLFVGVDDQIAVWLNGVKVHDSGPSSGGFEVDKTEVPLELAGGKNTLLVKIGNVSGGWEFAARIPGFDGVNFVKSKEPTPEEKQRAFALAAKPDGAWLNAGDAEKGAKIFADPAGPLGGICATCHAVRGQGGQVGPDLSAVGTLYKRGDLVTSIHEPSKTIALGFEQVMVETKAGETFVGALRGETADALTLVGADAAPHVVKKAEVKTQTAIPTSLMPQGLTLGLTPGQFTDLLAFLESLTGK